MLAHPVLSICRDIKVFKDSDNWWATGTCPRPWKSLASIDTDIIGGVKLHQLVRHFENEGRYAVEASIV